ncbi:MAG: FG-GAP-like repeat-containing protein [Victivallaceae bacterium]
MKPNLTVIAVLLLLSGFALAAAESAPSPLADRVHQLRPPVLTQAATLAKDIPLVKDGKADYLILHSDTPAGKAAADKIAAELTRSTGSAPLAVRSGTPADRIPDTHAIILGNLGNNPALQVLYARQQTLADNLVPGPGGWTVEALIEPLKRDKSVIILGASDDAGLAKAAEAFLTLARDHAVPGNLVFPNLLKTDYKVKLPERKVEPDYLKRGLAEADRRIKEGVHTSVAGYLHNIATRYTMYRNPEDAKLFVAVAKRYAESAKPDAAKYGGPWGFDSDFRSFQVIAGWDNLEHEPSLTDADRLAVSNMLLRWVNEAIFPGAKIGLSGQGPVSNHLTFASRGSLLAGLYFNKYYAKELPQAAIWLEVAQSNFRRQAAAAKVIDDCDSYQWLTWNHLLGYSLALPDDTVFKNGVAAKMLRMCALTMDNLGYQAPYGDSNGWTSGGGELGVLELYYCATRDPLAAAMLKIKRAGKKTGPYNFVTALGSDAAEIPSGLQVLKLDRSYFDHVAASEPKTPFEKCFDKFAYRAKFDPAALYVLIDGVNNGGHRHSDANSVLRFTQFGREWLAENDYVKNQQKYHNTLLILADGEAAALPDYMALEASTEDETAAAATVSAQVGAVKWVRYYIFLKKEDCWLLIDEATPAKAGVYRFVQRWNGIGVAAAKPDGVELTQQAAAMRFRTAADAKLTLTDDDDLGKQWVTYPHTAPVIRVIDQTVERKFKAGETVRLAALWHGVSGSGPVPEWALDRDGDGYFLHTGSASYRLKFAGASVKIEPVTAAPVTPRRAPEVAAAAIPAPGAKVNWSQKLESPLAPIKLPLDPKGKEQRATKRTEAELAKPQPVKFSKVIRFRDNGQTKLAASSFHGDVMLFDETGAKLGAWRVPAGISDIAAADLDGDGQSEFLLACEDAKLRAVKADGRELWSRDFEFYRIYPNPTIVEVADLDGDGKPEILAGCDNWKLYALDRDGKERWNYEVVHPVRRVQVADLDGDGKAEIVAGTRYMWITVLDANGKKRWGTKFGIGCRATAAPLNGQKTGRNVVAGIDNGLITFYTKNGDEIKSFATGDEIQMLAETPAGKNTEDVLAASYNGYVYRFSCDGNLRWSTALPSPVLLITPLPDGAVAAGTAGGEVAVLDAGGAIKSLKTFSGAIAGLLPGDGKLTVVTANGEIAEIALPGK